MARCGARRPGRARAVIAVAAVALLAGALVQPITHAQPAPDLSRARDLYKSAEAAMKDGRFDDAARDYGGSYEWSKDPALFFKIGRANERAGRCDVALIYYARYLREGTPNEQFTATTKERIAACGGEATVEGALPPGPGSDAPVPAGSAGSAAPAGSAAGPGSDGSADAGSADAGSAAGPGSAAPAAAGSASAPAKVPSPSNRHKAAWLLTGGAVALAALGGVLAYAANSSENDVRDLYVGFAGQPATFDGTTRRRYDELVDQGHRYEHLSWASFGLAGAAAAGAVALFVLGRPSDTEAPQRARVTPVVTPRGAGVVVRF